MKKFFVFILILIFNAVAATDVNDLLKRALKEPKKDDNKEERVVIDPNKIQSGETRKKQEDRKKNEEIEAPLNKKVLSSFKQWTVLSASPKGKDMCYSVVYSKRRVGNIENSEDAKAYFMVHYFSLYKQRVSIFFNYRLKLGSKIVISIDGRQFELQPLENYAFSEDAETDTAIVSALLTATRILVRGEGDDNTYSVDEYEATGFGHIYSKMKELCGRQK